MKFCTNCGNPLGSEKFCTKCGAKVDSVETQNKEYEKSNTFNKTARKSYGKVIKAMIGIIVVGTIIAVLILIFGGRGYKSVVKNYVDASMNADAEEIVSLLPDKMIEYIMLDEDYKTKGEMISELDDQLESALKTVKSTIGDDYKVTYEITETKDLTGDDLEDVKDDCRKYEIEPKAAKEVTVDLKVFLDDKEKKKSITITLIKLGRSWYLSDMY